MARVRAHVQPQERSLERDPMIGRVLWFPLVLACDVLVRLVCAWDVVVVRDLDDVDHEAGV